MFFSTILPIGIFSVILIKKKSVSKWLNGLVNKCEKYKKSQDEYIKEFDDIIQQRNDSKSFYLTIPETDLTFNMDDVLPLYHRIQGSETPMTWAQRVWRDNPHTWEPNKGAYWLWEHKKERSHIAFKRKK